jgi:RimJ/RimL family protein N-acetyltransferase
MDDYDYDTEEERYLIRRYRHLENCVLYLALIGKEIVGFLTLQGGALQRNRHVAQLGLAVAREHWGKGIGKQLMEQAVSWGQAHSEIRKISLLVYDDNDRAIRLYERFGFEHEGCLRKEVFIVETGAYVNLVAMGLCFDGES